MRSSIRKRYLRYYCAWMIAPSSLRRETPANALGPSRRAQVFFLCDRRGYDRSIAGLGAGRAQHYFTPDVDRSNRLAGWLARIEAVARARSSVVLHDLDWCFNAVPGRRNGKSTAKVRMSQ